MQAMTMGFLCTAIAVLFLGIDCQVTNKSSALETSDVLEHSLKENIASQDTSLLDVIFMAENMQNGKTNAENVHKFVNGSSQQEALIRQVLIEQNSLHASKNISEEAANVSNVYNPFKILIHQYLIDEMLIILDTLFVTQKSIVVFTDESKYGEIALARILQRCLETNRRIAAFKMISLKTTRKEIQNHMLSDLFVLDCDGKMAEKLLHFAKEMGYTGYRDNVNWVLSHRTMTSLPISCSLPVTRMFGIEAVFSSTDAKNASVSLQNCQMSRTFKEKVHCKRKHYNVKDVTAKQLCKKPSEGNGHVWITMKVFSGTRIPDTLSQSIYPEISHLNPLLPSFNVAVADTFEPWINIVDFSETIPELPLCGITGKYGYRYLNSTANITKPICAYGLDIDILHHLEETLEINSYIFVSRDGLYGDYNASNGKATGVVAEIASGAADFAVGLTDGPSRREVLDFTTPYEVTNRGIAYVHVYNHMGSGVFYTFSATLWLVLLAFLCGLIILLWILDNISKHQKRNITPAESKDTFSIADSIEYIWGTLCSGEIIQRKPRGVGSRLLSVLISCFFIVAVACYSANLITSLVVNEETSFITGLKDILSYGDKVGAQKASETANYLQYHHNIKVRQLFAKMQLFDSYELGVDALKHRKIEFFVSDYLSLTQTARMDKDCTFHVVEADSSVVFIGVAFKEGSTLKRKLNYAAAGLTNSGKKDRIFNYWFGSGKCKTSNDFYPLELNHFIKNLFFWLSSGLIASFLIMVISMVWKCKSKYRYSIETQ